MQENLVWFLGWEDSLKKGKAPHSSILAWRIPQTLQFMGFERVRHNWATFTSLLHFSNKMMLNSIRCLFFYLLYKFPFDFFCDSRIFWRAFWGMIFKVVWRREWQPTRVFLPGQFHGERSLMGYSPWGSQRVRHDWATFTFSTWKAHRVLQQRF